MSTSILTTTKVFIPHDSLVWITGELLSENDESVEVRIIDTDFPTSRSSVVKISKTHQSQSSPLPLQNTDTPLEGVDDMCVLSYLHEPAILDNLRR